MAVEATVEVDVEVDIATMIVVEAEAVIVVAEEATGVEEGGGISIGVGWCDYSFTQNGWPGV